MKRKPTFTKSETEFVTEYFLGWDSLTLVEYCLERLDADTINELKEIHKTLNDMRAA